MHNLTLYVSAFSVSAVLIHVFKNHAVRVGLVDYPCERKRHCGEVPLIGGIAIYLTFAICLLISDLSVQEHAALLTGSLILIVVGIVDDRKALSSRSRFLAQIFTAGLMCVWGDVVLYDLGVLSFDGTLFILGGLAVPFTIFATVGVINAVNMSDGIDGLSGSLALVALIGLAIATYISGEHTDEFKTIMVLISALGAFLFFNVRFPGRVRALVFLGDAGSMFLGFVLSWFVISLTQGEQRLLSPVTALWFLAMPLFDTVGIMLRRILKGRSPFRADREHFHHAFQLAGFSVFQTQMIITGIALILMGFGLVGQYLNVSEIVMFELFLALFALYFLGIMRAWKVMRFLRRTMHLEKETTQPAASVQASPAVLALRPDSAAQSKVVVNEAATGSRQAGTIAKAQDSTLETGANPGKTVVKRDSTTPVRH